MSVVFVSSTFRDMHFERDAIRDRVAPLVNRKAHEYGQHVSFEDLRWGIDTSTIDSSHEADRKVLDICLDEIDRSDPPMIVILGDRYGWMPGVDEQGNETGSKLIKETWRRKLDEELEDDLISVTALEIEYGALRAESGLFNNALFYFRKIEGSNCPDDCRGEQDAYHAAKRAELKRRIEALHENYEIDHGFPMESYSLRFKDGKTAPVGIDAFVEKVANQVIAMLLPKWEEDAKRTPMERTIQAHLRLMREKSRLFTARLAELERYSRALEDDADARIIIKGDSGSGKTTLLAAIANRLMAGDQGVLKADTDYHVLFLSCGHTPNTGDAVGVLRVIVGWVYSLIYGYEMENIDKRDSKTLEADLEELCSKCLEAETNVIVLVDAIDQLLPGECRDRLAFLPHGRGIRYCVTCTSDFNLGGRMCEYLSPLAGVDERTLVLESLKTYQGWHELGAAKEKLLSRPASESPLYLSLVMQSILLLQRADYLAIEARAHDGLRHAEAIDSYLAEVLDSCPETLEEMSAHLIMSAIARIGANEALMRRAIEYIAVSRRGLRREDLERLLQAEPDESAAHGHLEEAALAFLMNYYRSCFMTREDGRIDFTHKSIRLGVMQSIGVEERNHFEEMRKRHGAILGLLRNADGGNDGDPVRDEEIVYHAFWSRNGGFLLEYLSQCSLCRSGDALQKRCLDGAEADIRACIEADGEGWFASELLKASEQDGRGTLDFLNEVAYRFSVVGQLGVAQLQKAKKVLESACVLADRICGEDAVEARDRFASTCYSLAFIRDKLGGSETQASLEAYARACCLRKQNFDVEPGNSVVAEAYARSCDNLASSLMRAHAKGVVDLAALDRIGGTLPGACSPIGERTRDLLLKELAIRKTILANLLSGDSYSDSYEKDLDVARENAAWAYSNVAKWFDVGSFSSVEFPESVLQEDVARIIPNESIAADSNQRWAYEVALRLRQIRVSSLDGCTVNAEKTDAWEKCAYSLLDLVGFLVARDDGSDDTSEVCRYASRACELREKVHAQRNAPKSLHDLGDAYRISASAYAVAKRWDDAVRRAYRAVESFSRAAMMLGTPDSLRDMAQCCLDASSVLIAWNKDLNTLSDTEKKHSTDPRSFEACGLLGMAVGILESLYASAPSNDCASVLRECYRNLSALYCGVSSERADFYKRRERQLLPFMQGAASSRRF